MSKDMRAAFAIAKDVKVSTLEVCLKEMQFLVAEQGGDVDSLRLHHVTPGANHLDLTFTYIPLPTLR